MVTPCSCPFPPPAAESADYAERRLSQPPRLGESSTGKAMETHGDFMGCNGIQWDLTYEFTLWLLNIANVNIGLFLRTLEEMFKGFIAMF